MIDHKSLIELTSSNDTQIVNEKCNFYFNNGTEEDELKVF